MDDNREIFVPELNQTITAHPNFQLFATQNPVGNYSGRKRLSRAFLNRFIVRKFDHLPFDELPKIVEMRCGVSKTMAETMVKILVKLKTRKTTTAIFSAAQGLMTLRYKIYFLFTAFLKKHRRIKRIVIQPSYEILTA